MNAKDSSMEQLLDALKERAKELNCLYRIEEVLQNTDWPLEGLFWGVISALPSGFRYPEICQARIEYNGVNHAPVDWKESPWKLQEEIVIQSFRVGRIEVSYSREMPPLDDGPFMKEEAKLVRTVADRLGHTILHRQMEPLFQELHATKQALTEKTRHDWRIVLDMLRMTDLALYRRMARRMLIHLYSSGVAEAKSLLESMAASAQEDAGNGEEGGNRPLPKHRVEYTEEVCEQIFGLASRHLTDPLMFEHLQKWIHENKVSYLLETLEDHATPLSQVIDALTRFRFSESRQGELSLSMKNAITVSLIRRFFSRRLEFIDVAKKVADIDEYWDLSQRLIYHGSSRGKLGGKSAGLFLAMQAVRKSLEKYEYFKGIRTPKTWYIVSDVIQEFIHYNQMEEFFEHKYKDVGQIRREYPHIVQLFKNSAIPADIVQGLSMALDDFGETPLIVRSSSLLEDSLGAAFSGKYKSLFLANQGSKQQRLAALIDAVAEVYASAFGPDPIQYRTERGLLDFKEEMGVMIQQVVGARVDDWVFPAFAGVAFSRNELRWSPRIRRQDGLIRIVPGLGTRAVDRLGDDYPVLVAPGQPALRVNATVEETIRYAPRYLDLIDLSANSFQTVELADLLRRVGRRFPRWNQVFSLHQDGMLRKPASSLMDPDPGDMVATFEGLVSGTPFVRQIKSMLELFEETFETPVDIEFAADERDIYLLQCRPQSFSAGGQKTPLPHGVPADRTAFTARRYISDGAVSGVTHVVYVTPDGYDSLSSLEELRDVGHAVSRLNQILPRRKFILMGPGRWGSRGDIKLGVNVTYSDISNTAALIEVAFKKGNYVPDLSFGTHFFQDLVEAGIQYLPLYPDDPDVAFNRAFLHDTPSVLATLVPEFAALSEVVRVIDVPASTGGLLLRIVSNAEEGMAIGYLAEP